MNLLTIKANWGKPESRITEEVSAFSNGFLDLQVQRIHCFVFDTKNIFYDPDTKILCSIIGYVSNLGRLKSGHSISGENDTEIIGRLYYLNGPQFIKALDGIFSIFIWDGRKRTGYVFQDKHASNLPIYYANNKDRFVISTSLKEILKNASVKRQLNLSAIRDFLEARVITPNRSTLIKGVYKLTPRQYILIDGRKKSFQIRSFADSPKKVTREFARDNLLKSIKDNIDLLAGKLDPEDASCTLSGGFDTNLMLNYLSGTSKNVTALTIGGKVRNEIHQAQKLADLYDNVTHITSIVKEDKLDMFPDMVWRLEGYICQVGLFMQYELAEQLRDAGKKSIFAGECADQALDRYRKLFISRLGVEIKDIPRHYYHLFIKRDVPNEKIREGTIAKYLRRPALRIKYDVILEYVLKKSGIMLNSFDIQGIYPFLNNDTIAMSDALGKANSRKAFYKTEVSRVLGEEKMNLISKMGGHTDIEYLFEGRDGLVEKLLGSDLVRKILGKNQIANAKNDPEAYRNLILRMLFLYLFNELFVSGRFDAKFDEPRLDAKVGDFLK